MVDPVSFQEPTSGRTTGGLVSFSSLTSLQQLLGHEAGHAQAGQKKQGKYYACASRPLQLNTLEQHFDE